MLTANVTVFCFLASYVVAFALELTRLLGRNRLSRFVMLGFGAAGLVAHTILIFNRSRSAHLPPLLSSTYDWLLVLSWLLILIYLFLTAMDRELALGAFALPVVLLLIAATYFIEAPEASPLRAEDLEKARRGWLMLHAASLVFGMTGVAVGFVSGLMYMVQRRRLKTGHGAQQGWKMPNLERLAVVNRWSLMFAFLLLTLGFGSGIGLAIYPRDPAIRIAWTDPLVILSGAIWIALATVFVWLLRHRRPSGKQMAWLTGCALVFLLLTVAGLQIIAGSHAVRVGTIHHGDTESRRIEILGFQFSSSFRHTDSDIRHFFSSVTPCLRGEIRFRSTEEVRT